MDGWTCRKTVGLMDTTVDGQTALIQKGSKYVLHWSKTGRVFQVSLERL